MGPVIQALPRAIPTCVGTTGSKKALRRSYSGHPHMRGDYDSPPGWGGPDPGPSPHAWGLPPAFAFWCRGWWAIPTCVGTTADGEEILGQDRAIPTCVGTTLPEEELIRRITGHPHMRGDYLILRAQDPDGAGPSPHAWGLPPGLLESASASRAIPTCVGTTVDGNGDPAEHHGPSPHAWGLLEGGNRRVVGKRAIPTCVGTTGPGPPGPGPGPGHPHMRGDYEERPEVLGLVRGPSPHAWGLHMTQTAKTPADPPLCVCKGSQSRLAFQDPPCVSPGAHPEPKSPL